jgi:hypothetical protein
MIRRLTVPREQVNRPGSLALRFTAALALLLVSVFLPAQAPPESATLPDRATAEEARELIQLGRPIRLFCEPCGDRYVQEVRVISVTVEEHPEEEECRWVVRVNGYYLPIEEIYLRLEGEWRNLAHILGLAPEEVPETIYPFLRARPVPPAE